MRALFDVNVLIAFFDKDHPFHERAHLWWDRHQQQGWASCAITENGLLRIMSDPGYKTKMRISVEELIVQLRVFVERTDHEFWPEEISVRDKKIFAAEKLLNCRQLTDAYLLAMATEHDACLVTFDRNIAMSMVKKATAKNLCVL